MSTVTITKKFGWHKFTGFWGRQGLYTAQILLNSLVGYLFSRLLAYHFGVSAAKSGFDIAFSVPFIIMSLSGFTFLHAIISSMFARMLAHESPDLDTVFSSSLNIMWLIGGTLVIIGWFFSIPLTELLAPGLSPEIKSQIKVLIILMLPLVATLGTSVYFGAIFTAYHIPIPGEFALLMSRMGVVICAWFFIPQLSLSQVALILLGFSVISLIIEWVILVKITGLKYHLMINWKLPELQNTSKQALGFVGVAVVAQINAAYVRALATLDGPTTVAVLTYGLSVVTPLGVLLGKSLSFATGPRYVKLYEKHEYKAALRLITQYLTVSLLLSVGIVILINVNITGLIALLYGGGNFDASSVVDTASVTWPLIWSLPSTVVLWVALFPLLAKTKSQAGMTIYLIGYIVQIVLNYLLFAQLGRYILTWGYTISVTLQALLSVGYVVYRTQESGSKEVRC